MALAEKRTGGFDHSLVAATKTCLYSLQMMPAVLAIMVAVVVVEELQTAGRAGATKSFNTATRRQSLCSGPWWMNWRF